MTTNQALAILKLVTYSPLNDRGRMVYGALRGTYMRMRPYAFPPLGVEHIEVSCE